MSRLPAPRLLIYSQDGLGLGHLRRTTLLASEFLAGRPGATVLTMSDSPLGRFFAVGDGHDFLKLPSIVKAGPGKWSPVSLAMPFGDVLEVRKEVIRTTALTFRPDVLLVDHMPHGAMGELVATLDSLRSLPVRVVLGLRDILDAPATIRERWRVEGAFEAVERHYDEVLVYGSRDVFNVARQYAWPRAASDRLRYCGYVCSPVPEASSTSKARKRYRKACSHGDLIVAMAGGGADATELFDALLGAIPGVAAQRPCTVVLVTGPFLPRAERHRLLRRADGLPVRIIKSVSDATVLLGSADLVVAMAGYNTTAEILSLGKRALLVPRPGPSAEQQMRARLFAERNWVRWLAPESLSSAAIGQAVLEALTAPEAPPSAQPDLGGRRVAAQRLLAHAGETRRFREDSVIAANPLIAARPPASGHGAMSTDQTIPGQRESV